MTPTKAWLKSLPLVIAGPIAGWLLWAASGLIWDKGGVGIEAAFNLGLVVGIIGGLIHLISYAVIGLPLFHFVYGNEQTSSWSLGILFPVGLSLGLIAFIVLQLLIRGGDLTFMNPGILIIGPLYGLWTALCLYRFGFTKSEQDPFMKTSQPVRSESNRTSSADSYRR